MRRVWDQRGTAGPRDRSCERSRSDTSRKSAHTYIFPGQRAGGSTSNPHEPPDLVQAVWDRSRESRTPGTTSTPHLTCHESHSTHPTRPPRSTSPCPATTVIPSVRLVEPVAVVRRCCVACASEQVAHERSSPVRSRRRCASLTGPHRAFSGPWGRGEASQRASDGQPPPQHQLSPRFANGNEPTTKGHR